MERVFISFFEIFKLLVIFGTIYKLFELIIRRRERLEIVRKWDPSAPKSGRIEIPGISGGSYNRFGAIRTACVVMGLGLGLLVAMLITNGMEPDGAMAKQLHDSDINIKIMSGQLSGTGKSVIVYLVSMLMFIGAGLIVSYFIETRTLKKEAEEKKRPDQAGQD